MEIRRGPTASGLRDRFRSALHNDAATAFAGAGTDFDNPIAGGNHAHVVLDHYDGISGVNQAVELRDKAFDIGWMQTSCGLVENVKRVAALATLQLGGEFDALRFAAGEFGGRLTQAQIAEPNFA